MIYTNGVEMIIVIEVAKKHIVFESEQLKECEIKFSGVTGYSWLVDNKFEAVGFL